MSSCNVIVPVDVIVPCYRCASTIRRAVESIFAQSVIPATVILVEDCSGDETLIALNELEKIYCGRVKILQMDENKGAASARNAGWAVATQPYIAFLDADDSWHPEKLCVQYTFMVSHPDVALSSHQCVFLGGSKIFPLLPSATIFSTITAQSLLFRSAFSTPTVMLKRDIPFRFQEGARYGEDLLLWQQVAYSGMRIIRIESPLAYVHKPFYGAGGLSSQLWSMEKGELHNLLVLYQAGNVDFKLYAVAIFISMAKFVKRQVVTTLKHIVAPVFSIFIY